MFDIGFSELLLFGAIALIILGPEKLPLAARTAGRYYAKFRRTVASLQSEIEAELDLAETRKQMQAELAKIKQAEADMKREMDELRANMQELQQHGTVPPINKRIAPEPTDAVLADAHDDNAATVSSTNVPSTTPSSAHVTEPMYHQWFLLGEYDRVRRLPNAPLLPNYQADTLLASGSTPIGGDVSHG